jgi:hypothetical protein
LICCSADIGNPFAPLFIGQKLYASFSSVKSCKCWTCDVYGISIVHVNEWESKILCKLLMILWWVVQPSVFQQQVQVVVD